MYYNIAVKDVTLLIGQSAHDGRSKTKVYTE